MAEFQPKTFNKNQINGGKRYENGDAINAEAINAPIESALLIQSLATNQPDISGIAGTENPSVTIITDRNGNPIFKFENLGGKVGASGITPQIGINKETNEWQVSYDNGGSWIGLGGKAIGENGTNGLSAYEIWLSQGNTGSVDDFLKSLKGADGTMTFDDLTEEQKESLKGDKGDKGDKGADGTTPQKGKDYFTQEDIKQFVDDVLASLPTYDGSTSKPFEIETPPATYDDSFVTDKGNPIYYNVEVTDKVNGEGIYTKVYHLLNKNYGGNVGCLDLSDIPELSDEEKLNDYTLAVKLPSDIKSLGKYSFQLDDRYIVFAPATNNMEIWCDESKGAFEELLKDTSYDYDGVTATNAFIAYERGNSIYDGLGVITVLCDGGQVSLYAPLKREEN